MGFSARTAAPDGPYRVNDPGCLEAKAGRGCSLAGCDGGRLSASGFEGSCVGGSENGTADTSSAGETGVGSIDYRVHIHGGDICVIDIKRHRKSNQTR